MRRRIAESIVGAAIAAFFLFSAAVPAVADGPTFTVNSQLDQIDDDVATPGACHTAANTCTLRAAIMEANRSDLGATIVLPAGFYLLTIPPAGPNGESSGDLNLTTPESGNPVIRIVGAGAESAFISAGGIDRVLAVAPSRTASISGVSISGGYVPEQPGGGISNEGTLTLSKAEVSGNQAGTGGGIYSNHALAVIDTRIAGNSTGSGGGSGGGITSAGDLIVRNSTIEENFTNLSGGGIETALTMTLQNSTISGNRAGYAGGVFNSGDMIAVNSTISQNDANGSGGGLYNTGTANVYNTTIVLNGADADGDSEGSGGGVNNDDAEGAIFNLRNTLVAGNVTSDSTLFGYYDDCSGTLTGYGENLFKAVLVASNCTVNGNWGVFDGLDKLGPLQDNGGPTQTHALLTGSNAIDGTSGSGCVDENSVPIQTDQRGAPRVSGLRCDVGAFEVPEPGPMAAVAAAITTLASLRRARLRRRE